MYRTGSLRTNLRCHHLPPNYKCFHYVLSKEDDSQGTRQTPYLLPLRRRQRNFSPRVWGSWVEGLRGGWLD